MLKEKMVTRTIVKAEAIVMVYNESAEALEREVVTIPEQFTKDDATALKYLNGQWNGLHRKAVAIKSITLEEKLYGMPESRFLEYAEELPPRGSKAE